MTNEHRRVRVFARKAGWRFAYEVRPNARAEWERVQEREPGTHWSYEECLNRAETYASLVYATVEVEGMRFADETLTPPPPREKPLQLALMLGDSPNRGQLALS